MQNRFHAATERVVVTAAATIATGITGMNIGPASYFDPNIILTFAMGVLPFSQTLQLSLVLPTAVANLLNLAVSNSQ